MKEHTINTITEFERIRSEYKKIYFENKLSDENYVGHLPNQIDKVILFLNLNLQNFHDNLCNKAKFDLILPTGSFSDYNEVLQTYFKQNKTAFIYNLSSVIETFFRRLYEEKFPDKKIDSKNFHLIATKIFETFSFEYNNEWKGLMILFNLRNTIHNNGIHISHNRVFKYHNFELNFVKGFPQNVAHFQILSQILIDFKELFIRILKKNFC